MALIKLRYTIPLLVAAFALLTESGAAALRPFATNVRPTVANAPATVRVTISLEPDERNRALTVELDSDAFYRSSGRVIHGDQDARVHEFTFVDVPAGRYEVRSTVVRSSGQGTVQRGRVMVFGADRK